jgi:hypothetical protein
VGHRLAELGLADEAVIAGLLETHPADQLDINLCDFGADGNATTRTGARGRSSGAEILQAVKDGRLWINLRAVETRSDAFGAVVANIMDDLRAAMPGFEAMTAQGNLLVSGPTARVPMHADPPDVFLFHLIGNKRIWIYPPTEAFAPEPLLEKVCLGEATEDMPYSPAFDAHAAVFDLSPGQAIAWPQNAPHRVDNLGTFNVSLSVEYRTWTSRFKEGALYCNGTLRNRFGLKPPPVSGMSRPQRAVRWALGQAFKRMGVNRATQKRHAVEFDVRDAQPQG